MLGRLCSSWQKEKSNYENRMVPKYVPAGTKKMGFDKQKVLQNGLKKNG